ncbi:acyltransferase [Flavobacterium sp. N1994]|uniref:acyltransferase n=1 Tax=Flavobacterium sp. N1994 TaxID=2986827 RepID=UPI002221C14C|nr:acyltransferase [Flavobacterium sp. N1994]
MGFLSKEQLLSIGFKYLGKNVNISDRAVFYNPGNISIDDNSRIDDFCILSAGEGGIQIGKYIHIAAYCSMQGSGKITMEDFSGLSSRVALYSSSDDYSGGAMTNPCVPKEYTNVISGDITIKKHTIIGVSSCILPNVTIGEGSAIGAFSLVSKSIEDHVIAVGVPAKAKVPRKTTIFELEKKFLAEKKE